MKEWGLKDQPMYQLMTENWTGLKRRLIGSEAYQALQSGFVPIAV